eukprot:2265736-Prymnesium_polylepis.3
MRLVSGWRPRSSPRPTSAFSFGVDSCRSRPFSHRPAQPASDKACEPQKKARVGAEKRQLVCPETTCLSGGLVALVMLAIVTVRPNPFV